MKRKINKETLLNQSNYKKNKSMGNDCESNNSGFILMLLIVILYILFLIINHSIYKKRNMKTYTSTNSDNIIYYKYDETSYNFREEYEKSLKKRQEEHLNNINFLNNNWQPCLHDNCPDCVGTGIRKDGGMCVHLISCPCPKCSPSNSVI